MLGEITHDDGTYTGDTGDSVLSMQYYRNKATEFQATMNAVAEVEASLRATLDTVTFSDATDSELVDQIQMALMAFEEKRGQWVMATEAINFAANTLNSAGVRFPVLSAPNGLGLAPAAAIAVVAGAIAGAAILISWGLGWINQSKDLQLAALNSISDPVKRDEVAAQIARTAAAQSSALNPLSSMAGIVKWGAIAVLAFMGWKVFKDLKG